MTSAFDLPITRQVLESIVAELVAHAEVAWAGICDPQAEMQWLAVEGDPERWPIGDPEQTFARLDGRPAPPGTWLLELVPVVEHRRVYAGALRSPNLLVAVVPESSDVHLRTVVFEAIASTLERLRESFPVDEEEAPPPPVGGSSPGGPAPAHDWLPLRLPRRSS